MCRNIYASGEFLSQLVSSQEQALSYPFFFFVCFITVFPSHDFDISPGASQPIVQTCTFISQIFFLCVYDFPICTLTLHSSHYSSIICFHGFLLVYPILVLLIAICFMKLEPKAIKRKTKEDLNSLLYYIWNFLRTPCCELKCHMGIQRAIGEVFYLNCLRKGRHFEKVLCCYMIDLASWNYTNKG